MGEFVEQFVSATPRGARWVLVTSVLYVASFVFSPGPLAQAPMTFLFLLTCPGALLWDWVGFSNTVSFVATAVTLSLAVNTLLATVLVGLQTYSALNGLIFTAALSATGAIVSTIRSTQGSSPVPTLVSG